MSDKLNDFLTELQDQIYDDTIRDYGQDAFQRWLNPLYMYAMKDPDGYACITGPCGDTMQIFLRFEGGRVKEASFQTDGCGPSMVCGSLAAELAYNKQPEEAKEVSNRTILETIGGLPEEDQHCAVLAANTLREAIDNYLQRRIVKVKGVSGNHPNGG